MPQIIGLYSPYPRMGKSTVAKFLVETFGYTLLKFSAPVKEPLYQLGLSEIEIEGALKDQPHQRLNGLTPRQKMHEISQKLFAEFGHDSLSQIMRKKIDACPLDLQKIVIDDVRFEENYHLIRSYDRTQLWRVALKDVPAIPAHDTAKLENLAFDARLERMDGEQSLQKQIAKYLHIFD